MGKEEVKFHLWWHKMVLSLSKINNDVNSHFIPILTVTDLVRGRLKLINYIFLIHFKETLNFKEFSFAKMNVIITENGEYINWISFDFLRILKTFRRFIQKIWINRVIYNLFIYLIQYRSRIFLRPTVRNLNICVSILAHNLPRTSRYCNGVSGLQKQRERGPLENKGKLENPFIRFLSFSMGSLGVHQITAFHIRAPRRHWLIYCVLS